MLDTRHAATLIYRIVAAYDMPALLCAAALRAMLRYYAMLMMFARYYCCAIFLLRNMSCFENITPPY